MTTPAIQVENLGKQYRLGQLEPYRTLRDAISRRLRKPFQSGDADIGKDATTEARHVWAIRNVSFDVEKGEVLGIIGPNGAGKTTLLKVLSRVTEPTEGRVEIRGRVGSLLEVGTGFHPELTGRENVYLNGAILGMKKAEIAEKFEEIVAFAELDRFMNTPVKRYSSGMHLRLAFAVAAHLEPEIMLVDEVLAVGDAAFQKKCLGKMGDVAEEGRTVILVSHNMPAIKNLCARALWLDEGEIVKDNKADSVVAAYLGGLASSSASQRSWNLLDSAPGNEEVRLRGARVVTQNGIPVDEMNTRTPFALEIEYWNLRQNAELNLSLALYDEEGVCVFVTMTGSDEKWHGRPFPKGVFKSTCQIPGNLLNNGTYRVLLQVVKNSTIVIHREEELLTFEIHDDLEGRDRWYGKWVGAVRPKLQWKTEFVERFEPLAGE